MGSKRVPALAAALLASLSLEGGERVLAPGGVLDDDRAFDPILERRPEGVYVKNTGWKVAGDVRTGWVDYDYGNPPGEGYDPNVNRGHKNSRGFYLIPKFSLASPRWGGWSAKATAAGVTDFGLNDADYESRTFALGTDNKSYAILQEAYVEYEDALHSFCAGAREIVTPMIDADDWYLLADTFQAAYYINRGFDNLRWGFAYFHRMAGPWDSGSRTGSEEYSSMSEASFLPAEVKDRIDDKGVYTVAAVYERGPHKLQLWDYYGVDMYNTFFAQYDYVNAYKSVEYDFGLQFINFDDVGEMADYEGGSICPAQC